MKTYSKQEIAETQLNRAINLLIDEQDVISAITLAGAAEEILGELLHLKGIESVLSEMANEYAILGSFTGQNISQKQFKYSINFYRNELKHHDKGLDFMPIPIEAENEIIIRAAENLRRLTGYFPESVIRFQSLVY